MKTSVKKRVKTQLGMIIAIVIVYMILEIYGVTALHFRYVKIDRESSDTLSCISEIRTKINEIDDGVLKMLVNKNFNQKTIVQEDIDQCKTKMREFRNYSVSDDETFEYNQLNEYFNSYISGVTYILDNSSSKDPKELYANIDSLRNQMAESAERLFEVSDKNHVSKMQSAALQRDITANGTTILSIAFLVILIKMDRKRMNTEKELIQTEEKVVKQKKKISTAVLKDVLTETENRMSFINRFSGENSRINEGYAYYFVMLDIDDFSSVNSTYGVKSGDLILNSTANKIMNVFEGSAVYRTGSDEFVVAVSTTSDSAGYNRVTGLIEKAREALNTAHKIKSGSLVVSYSISVVKKTGPCSVDSSVLGTLKESLKQGRMTQPGTVMFTELN